MSGASRIRRITKDQLNLRASPPIDYFFFDSPSSSNSASLNEDITSVDVFLLGPTATAFENGVFRVSLKLGSTYPNEPPTACFKTRCFHPNINETNGDVCVDTLKNGWTSQLTLIDVLSTIRCLLISPNPTSALNAEAALLADTDYKAFEKQARLFTKIHASPPPEMKDAVKEAREARARREGASEGEGGGKSKSSAATRKALSKEQKKSQAATKETAVTEQSDEKEEEKSGDDEGKENTTSGHANNAAIDLKKPVSKKRSFDNVFEKETAAAALTSKNSDLTSVDRETDDVSAPLPKKKILRSASDTKALSTSTATVKGRSVSTGSQKTGAKSGASRKGLRRL